MKIVYCATQMHKPGGTEKVLADKISYLVENTDFEIHIITEDQRGKSFFFEFSPKVVMHDMAVSELNKKIIPGITFIQNVFKLRKLYADKLSQINPDIVVVVERGYLDFVIPFIRGKWCNIREFHFAKEAVESHTKLMDGLFKRIRHKLRYNLLFKMFNRYDYLVLLTKRDQENGKYKVKTKVIYNMLKSIPDETARLTSKNVISVGSMYDKRKNFKEQILLWKKVKETHPEWVLNIYGDGQERSRLQKLIDKNNLNGHVILHGNTNKIAEKYNDSSIFLFTSQAEGYPMVLIEAQSNGLPCVAYDAPTGPSEIIDDKKNGFLIENNNILELEKKLTLLMMNEDLRMEMGKNARESSKKYLPNIFMQKWVHFFKELHIKNK